VLAAGDDWEELSYLDGEVAADPAWQPGRGHRLPPYARTDAALSAAGRLIRALHEASAGSEPVEPVADLAAAAWAFVPLASPGQLDQAGFDPLPDLPDRLRLFLDAYGLADRASILPAVERSPLASAEVIRYYPLDASGAADSLEFLAGQLRWIHSLVPGLARAL
jgi:hypothetical protein